MLAPLPPPAAPTMPAPARNGVASPPFLAGAGVSAFGALVFSSWLIRAHLRNYTEPVLQRYIVRIIVMVPVYAACSFFSLAFPRSSVYYDAFRDIFEAWVIYNFFSLLVAYLGGPGAVLTQLQGTVIKKSLLMGTCVDVEVDARFIRLCKQGTLQFVLLKPLLAAITVATEAHGKYCEGHFLPGCWYTYQIVVYNASYFVALYSLVMFYMGSKTILAPHRPLLKFALVKAVVFFTFWQGVAISVVVSMGALAQIGWDDEREAQEGRAIQNFIICLEMSVASYFMYVAFPFREYAHTQGIQGSLLSSLRDAVSMEDIRSDTNTAFSAVYQNYVCFSDGSRQVFRTKTFVPNAGFGTPMGGGAGIPDEDDAEGALGGGSTALEMEDGGMAAVSPPLGPLPYVTSPQIKRRLDTSAGALKPPPKRSPRKTKPSSEGVSEGSGSQLALPPAVLPSAAEHVEPTPALEPPPSIPTRKQTAVAEGNPLDDSVADDV